MSEHEGLPVKGYQPQSADAVEFVNQNKVYEEMILRRLDDMLKDDNVDYRWANIARTNIEQGFMAMNRAIFKPARLELDADN